MLNFYILMSFLLILVAFGLSSVYAQVSDEVVVLHTSSGDIVIELFSNDAPKTVSNFVDLSKQGFYDGTIFHRIIKDFMIQGGDPNTKDTKKITEWGYGGADHTVPAEFNTIMHKRGIVSMARNADPDSASSQFFIVHKDAQALDQQYTVFGRLVTQESFGTLDKIAELETTGPATNYIPTDPFEAEIQTAEVKNRSDIADLLDQKDPPRIQPPVIESVQPYSNEDLGISFDTVSTWEIQETQNQDERYPDVTIMGPTDGAFTPSVLVFVKNSTSTSLEEFSAETKKFYDELIKTGYLTILGEEKTSINGNDAWVRNSHGRSVTAYGTFDVQYRETTFQGDEKFYTVTYVNTVDNFDGSLPKYDQIINSLTIKENPSDGGCLIATATYGTELAPQVQLLREVRDNVLFSTGAGKTFMAGFNDFYYTFSPAVADLERQNPLFKEIVKTAITPLLSILSILNHVEIDSEQEMLGYGVGVMLLNIGMYFVAPAIIIIKLKQKFRKI